jgi:hypothetical protein
LEKWEENGIVQFRIKINLNPMQSNYSLFVHTLSPVYIFILNKFEDESSPSQGDHM